MSFRRLCRNEYIKLIYGLLNSDRSPAGSDALIRWLMGHWQRWLSTKEMTLKAWANAPSCGASPSGCLAEILPRPTPSQSHIPIWASDLYLIRKISNEQMHRQFFISQGRDADSFRHFDLKLVKWPVKSTLLKAFLTPFHCKWGIWNCPLFPGQAPEKQQAWPHTVSEIWISDTEKKLWHC